jgi:hypothetical protein
VCPDEPQRRLRSIAQSLKTRPHHLYPESPRNPAEKAPKQTQYLVSKFPCRTIAFLVYLIQPKASSYQFNQYPAKSEFLSIRICPFVTYQLSSDVKFLEILPIN